MIDKLEMFLVLAREQHFGRAADACNISQPSLSAAIKHLEEHLGVMLVRRGARYQGLTPEGQRVLEWARRMVGDARTMREEMRLARTGLAGHVRIAAIPTALAMTAELTTPIRRKHPDVTFTILSQTSIEVLASLENLQIDAGITYLDNEPLGRVVAIPLYIERYQLITSATGRFAKRKSVTWEEAASEPLCLLTPDMQNRRIINNLIAQAGAEPRTTLESNSMIALFAHIRTGEWASIMPLNLVETLGLAEPVRAIPIVEPDVGHTIGLVVAQREPHTPIVSVLMHFARQVAAMRHSL